MLYLILILTLLILLLMGNSNEALCYFAGPKDEHIPPMPPLTQCKVSKSWRGSSKSEAKIEVQHNQQNRKTYPSSGNLTYNMPYMCVRINTLEYINSQLPFLEKKIQYGWKKDEPVAPPLRNRNLHLPQ